MRGLRVFSTVFIALAMVTTGASAQTLNGLPDTTVGVHAAAPFLRCYSELWAAIGSRSNCPPASESTPITSLQGKIDTGSMWSYGLYSPRQLGINIDLAAALKIDRFPGYAVNSPRWPTDTPVTLSQWQQSHPDWIEYTCAVNSVDGHTTPAWEFGQAPQSANSDAYVPFNIDDPQARQFFFDTYIKPSLDNGYRIIMFDNVYIEKNVWGRCGHRYGDGQFQQQYTGTHKYDLHYEADMLSWLTWLRDEIHSYAPGALLGINYSPVGQGDPPAVYEQVFKIVDLVWDEGGFTDWGVGPLSRPRNLWNQEFLEMRWLAAQPDKAVIINGIGGGHSSTSPSQITAAQRQWIIANYLLVKGAHTYATITPDEYGTFDDFPEFHIPIGAATNTAYQSQGVWMRDFTGGRTIVNPDTVAHVITVPLGYTNIYGQPVSGAVSLNPTTGLVLLGETVVGTQTLSHPTLSHVSLSGIARHKPRFAFTLSEATDAPPIRTIAVRLSSGLRFSRNRRHLARNIVLIGTTGKRVTFSAKVRYGALTITLKSAATHVRTTIAYPEIVAGKALTRSVKRKRSSQLRFRVRATDSGRTTTLLPFSLKAG